LGIKITTCVIFDGSISQKVRFFKKNDYFDDHVKIGRIKSTIKYNILYN